MANKWNDLKAELFADYPICKLCRINPAVHLHHAIINKGKVRNRKFHKFLDHKYNALPVCHECHITADSYKNRERAWMINCEEYGMNEMEAWYQALPFKIREEF